MREKVMKPCYGKDTLWALTCCLAFLDPPKDTATEALKQLGMGLADIRESVIAVAQANLKQIHRDVMNRAEAAGDWKLVRKMRRWLQTRRAPWEFDEAPGDAGY